MLLICLPFKIAEMCVIINYVFLINNKIDICFSRLNYEVNYSFFSNDQI